MALLKNGKYTITFPSHTKYLEKAEAITVQIAQEANFDNSCIDDFAIAITELFNNAVHHGNKQDPKKQVTLTYRLLTNGLQISVKDQGRGFNPDTLKDPVAPENLLAESGRGIYLVKHLMDDIQFKIDDNGTEVIVFKALHKPLTTRRVR